VARAEAVAGVLDMAEFQAIAAACKRMRNILRQAGEKKIAVAIKFDPQSLLSDEEKPLAAFVERTAPEVEKLREQKKYREALLLLATARNPVDRFLRQSHGHGGRRARARESIGPLAGFAQRILYSR